MDIIDLVRELHNIDTICLAGSVTWHHHSSLLLPVGIINKMHIKYDKLSGIILTTIVISA